MNTALDNKEPIAGYNSPVTYSLWISNEEISKLYSQVQTIKQQHLDLKNDCMQMQMKMDQDFEKIQSILNQLHLQNQKQYDTQEDLIQKMKEFQIRKTNSYLRQHQPFPFMPTSQSLDFWIKQMKNSSNNNNSKGNPLSHI